MLNSKDYGKRVRNNPLSFLIIGCGYFGSRAAQELYKKYPRSKITVVDRDEEALRKLSHLPIEIIHSDGLLYLSWLLGRGPFPDYIIPAVPFHLAFEFLTSEMKPRGIKRGKTPPLPTLPNLSAGKSGDLYASLADFLCPEDCPEPSGYCAVTRKRRQEPLYKILTDLTGPFESRVIRSEQLGLGVGGFRTKTLMALLKGVKKQTPSAHPILISTACRCHGVISALSFQKTKK